MFVCVCVSSAYSMRCVKCTNYLAIYIISYNLAEDNIYDITQKIGLGL